MELFKLSAMINKGKRMFVIQIGANRGEDFVKGESLDDPVVEFVVNNKTNGLLVEAVPSNYQILLQNTEMYKERFKRVNAAVIHPKVSDNMGFFNINTTRVLERWPDAPYWIAKNRIGSFDENHVRKHLAGHASKLSLTGDWIKYYIAKINIPTKEPSEIHAILHESFPESKDQPLSLLHVDAEGYDWKIARPFLEYTLPRIVVFERNHLADEEIDSALGVLKQKGYATWSSGNNIYAVYLGNKLYSDFLQCGTIDTRNSRRGNFTLTSNK